MGRQRGLWLREMPQRERRADDDHGQGARHPGRRNGEIGCLQGDRSKRTVEPRLPHAAGADGPGVRQGFAHVDVQRRRPQGRICLRRLQYGGSRRPHPHLRKRDVQEVDRQSDRDRTHPTHRAVQADSFIRGRPEDMERSGQSLFRRLLPQAVRPVPRMGRRAAQAGRHPSGRVRRLSCPVHE